MDGKRVAECVLGRHQWHGALADALGARGTTGRAGLSSTRRVGPPCRLRHVPGHREFALFRCFSLELGLNVFNILSHPAFADPVPFLSSPCFGQSTSIQDLMLGSGSANTGLPALFQSGGPRSAELIFRLSF